jgi:starch synthase
VSKPRVALVALHWAQYSVSLALALAESREVLLVLYRDNADAELGTAWPNRIKESGLALLVLERPKSALAVIRNTRRLVSAIKRFGPEVIHYQETLRDELILGLPFLSATPTVLTVHDPIFHSGVDTHQLRFSRIRLYRPLLRAAADIAITHGRVLADDLVKEYPRFKGRVRSVPHGPYALGDSNDTVRPGDCRLLFFGRIHEYKGLRYFVEAVIALRSKGYPVTGVVAGQGSDMERHRKRMVEAGCFEILDRFISAEEVRALFLSSLVIVLSHTEATQSGVAAMALGCGRPVVASAVGSIPELVRNGVNGLLVPPSDPVALTNAIELVITDDELWRTLAVGAAKLRDGEFSWKVRASEMIRAYDSLVDLT